jgi:hypothetical protein
MEFFLKCLNPFKFETKFESSLLPEFLIQIVLRIWTSSQKESCSFWICLWLDKFGNFWIRGVIVFVYCKFRVVQILEKIWKIS